MALSKSGVWVESCTFLSACITSSPAIYIIICIIIRPSAKNKCCASAFCTNAQRHPHFSLSKKSGISPFFGAYCLFIAVSSGSSIQLASICRDGYHLPRNKLSAGSKSIFDGGFNPSAAGNLHPYHRHALNVVPGNDRRQLFRIIHLVQLGAANQRDMPADKLVVEISIGIGSAVCGNEEIRTVKLRCVCRDQFDLHGPLEQLGRRISAARNGAFPFDFP